MEDLLFTLNAVMPIILLVLIGYLLKRIGLLTTDVAKAVNKLVFRVLLPAMLFLNVYKIESFGDISVGFMVYAAIFVVAIFFISIFVSGFVTHAPSQRGVIVQAIFRSNFTLIGLSLAASIAGDAGAAAASLMSVFIVPLFNVLAVVALCIFNKDGNGDGGVKVSKIILGIIKNPLIDAITLGLVFVAIRALFVACDISFRLTDIGFLYKTIEQLSVCATPIALIMLGANFEFSAIKELKVPIIFSVIARCLVVPVLGFGIALLIGKFSTAHFAAFIGVFATPVAVSTVPMAQEMRGDAALAGQLVVWTALFSTLTVFLTTYILRVIGIF